MNKHVSRGILISDLDGTLLPLTNCIQNWEDLKTLRQALAEYDVDLVFCTGRHFESVKAAIAEFLLPAPSQIIADVGTSIYVQQVGGQFGLSRPYSEHLDHIVSGHTVADLKSLLAPIQQLRIQEQEKQGRFKLSYYAPAEDLTAIVAEINARLGNSAAPFSVISSVDPFNGDGLVDLLPNGVSKAYAVEWLIHRSDLKVVFAGDSGNDLAVFLSGVRSIVVGNADRDLCENVAAAHRRRGWKDRVYMARNTATSGVVEGCRHFGLFGGREN